MPGASQRPAIGVVALCAALVAGCVTPASLPMAGTPATLYRYFEPPAADDPWSSKIGGWQGRERGLADPRAGEELASVSGSGAAAAARPGRADDLRDKYLSFRAERRRAAARELASWVQDQAKRHYRPDGPVDHWATLEETLGADGDDCDGLELLTFYLLLDLGFDPERVYRAIVYRPADGQHHMVTFWFESEDDPWVIDPTGAMTHGMPRMSEVPGWVPLKIFSETAEYSVSHESAARLAHSLNP